MKNGLLLVAIIPKESLQNNYLLDKSTSVSVCHIIHAYMYMPDGMLVNPDPPADIRSAGSQVTTATNHQYDQDCIHKLEILSPARVLEWIQSMPYYTRFFGKFDGRKTLAPTLRFIHRNGKWTVYVTIHHFPFKNPKN